MNKSKLHSDVVRLPQYRGLSARARSVFQLLWSKAGGAEAFEDGEIFVGCRVRIETVAESEGCSVRTVKRALGEIEAAGLLDRSRTGRASEFRLLTSPESGRVDGTEHVPSEVPNLAHQKCQKWPIRGVKNGTSEVPNLAHRAAPSNYLHHYHSSTTSSPQGEHQRAAAVGGADGGSRPPEPAGLDGAAAVAFEMLTGRSCPPAVRFRSEFDRSSVRRLVAALADQQFPVVEIVRYALELCREPGVRNPRGVVVSTLREPDLHAVYEHARRLERRAAAVRASESSRARESSEAAEAERSRREAHERAEAALASASPAEISAALDRVMEANAFIRTRARRSPDQSPLDIPGVRRLVADALTSCAAAGAANHERAVHGQVQV